LDEFVFRHNRRKQPMAAFQTLGTEHTADALASHPGRPRYCSSSWRRLISPYGGLLKQPDKQELAKVVNRPILRTAGVNSSPVVSPALRHRTPIDDNGRRPATGGHRAPSALPSDPVQPCHASAAGSHVNAALHSLRQFGHGIAPDDAPKRV
jgi:hypothetical protein